MRFCTFCFILCGLAKCLVAYQPSSSAFEKHCLSIREKIEIRWCLFEKERAFQPFSPKRSEASLKEEFEKIRSVRSKIWTQPEYARANYLIEQGSIRAPRAAAFAYNNTVPYYNASTVYLNKIFYIACEGPRAKDVSRFFNLLASQHVSHLVRLTDVREGSIEKCHPYWEDLGIIFEEKAYLTIPTEMGSYPVRSFDMAYWKDNQGVAADQLLAMVLQVKKELLVTNGLLAVHCSAGVGRTGTFLAAMAIVDAINQKRPFSIEEIVFRLSLQRVSSVARVEQYITLYRLAEQYMDNFS